MGTKTNPGAFDCHKAAADDEPIFTLRSTDPFAPTLVRLWAAARAQDSVRLEEEFETLVALALNDKRPAKPAKVEEAMHLATAMTLYRP